MTPSTQQLSPPTPSPATVAGVEVPSVAGALDLYRAIQASNLSRVEQSVALALLRFASRKKTGAWWAPWEGPSAEGGVAVATLAAVAKYSRRHTRRALVALQARGLVVIVSRSWRTNAYKIEEAAWFALAEVRHGLVVTSPGLDLPELLELSEPERQAAVDIEVTARDQGAPSWALELARKLKARVKVVVELVQGTVSRLCGGEADEQTCALEAGRVIHLWAKVGRPSAAVWLEHVDAVATAARVCVGPRWARLRGERHGLLGEDRSQSLRTLLRPASWGDHVRAARAHASGACPCCSTPATPEAELGVAVAEGWATDGALRRFLPEGQDGAVQMPADLVAWWNELQVRLLDRMGQQDWTIWCAPVAVQEIAGGVAWLRVPNMWYGRWLTDQWLFLLSEVAGGPVGFVVRIE